ncbi:hypothetical protein [Marinilabilia salmonicolor]|uniref:hypothetical protein n=1 Tax=Marinilabilia salmonicolor TaxID=989 RepID=UPI00029A205A|nr:hypothetical protein [Marinilabilia salmonicolor]
MKKVILTLALVAGFAFAANNVNAQTNSENDQKKENPENVRSGFVDNNADGVCDNFDGKRPGKGLGPGNGNGQGRGQGKGLGRSGNGQGRGGNGNFTDSNKNGTCDNLENGTGRLRDGSGNGRGNAPAK